MSKRNYISELIDEDILSLLKVLNYNLQPFIVDRQTDEFLPAITRSINEETQKEELFVRCTKKENKFKEQYNLLSKHPLLKPFNQIYGKFGKELLSGNGFLILSDFEIMESFMDDVFDFVTETEEKETSEDKFINFMIEKFGDEYIEDYNNFADEFNKKLEQKQAAEKSEDTEQITHKEKEDVEPNL